MGKQPRQRPISCKFCRLRKLRCSRQFPCTNCTSRGVPCQASDEVPTRSTHPDTSSSVNGTHGDSLATLSAPEVLARLNRLEALVESHSRELGRKKKAYPRLGPLSPQSPVPSHLQGLMDDALSFSPIGRQSKQGPSSLTDVLVLRACPIRNFPAHPASEDMPNSLLPDGVVRTKRHIWLPSRSEALPIADIMTSHHGYYPKIIHVPSLPGIFSDLYDALEQGNRPNLGTAALLLSICALVTCTCLHTADAARLFSSNRGYTSRSEFWLKPALHIVEHLKTIGEVSLESLQALCLCYCALTNIHGVTQTTRLMTNDAIGIGRELGLHRIDYRQNAVDPSAGYQLTVKAEIGRRVWWFLAMLDWTLSQYSGPLEGVISIHPSHMAVRKPLNINDEDIIEGQPVFEKPPNQLTTTSYLLQRIRFAETFLEPLNSGWSTLATGDTMDYSSILEMDQKIQDFIRELPPFFSINSKEIRVIPNSMPASHANLECHAMTMVAHRHRCKIHLPFLMQSLSEPTYAPSREACLESARIIMQARNKLNQENTAPQHTLERSAYLAAIVLVLETCLDGKADHDPIRDEEMQDAWDILRDGQPQSPVVSKLLGLASETLKKNLKSHPTLNSLEQFSAAGTPDLGGAGHGPLETPGYSHQGNMTMDPLNHPSAESEIAYIEQQWQALEGGTELEAMDWDRFLSGIDIAPFL
ncbi:hypothetical protein B0I35DRAFT_71783 [Stachybotrys elegans]|uniref:Zn(2)-C6 fungal-type domain-containing protein n=1 Tax=Stachybotrys elegans TaxID=80388 RepID=A0A8K0WNC7_9HYPO|nr:hypothetical protein B0I35DRAFT_71783 [Stachybotrys elegans]